MVLLILPQQAWFSAAVQFILVSAVLLLLSPSSASFSTAMLMSVHAQCSTVWTGGG